MNVKHFLIVKDLQIERNLVKLNLIIVKIKIELNLLAMTIYH